MKFDFIHDSRVQRRGGKFAAAFKQQRDEWTLAESGQKRFPLRRVLQRDLFPSRGQIKFSAGENEPRGRLERVSRIIADGEFRRICEKCSGSDHYGVGPAAELLHAPARIGSGDPLRISRLSRNAPVERHGKFEKHERFSGRDPFEKGFVEFAALLFQHAGRDFDTVTAEQFHGASGVFRVRIRTADDDAGEFFAQNGVGAGRRSAPRGAGFESDVNG